MLKKYRILVFTTPEALGKSNAATSVSWVHTQKSSNTRDERPGIHYMHLKQILFTHPLERKWSQSDEVTWCKKPRDARCVTVQGGWLNWRTNIHR